MLAVRLLPEARTACSSVSGRRWRRGPGWAGPARRPGPAGLGREADCRAANAWKAGLRRGRDVPPSVLTRPRNGHRLHGRCGRTRLQRGLATTRVRSACRTGHGQLGELAASGSAMAGAPRPGWPRGRSTLGSESVMPSASRCSGLGAAPTCCRTRAYAPGKRGGPYSGYDSRAGQRQSSQHASSSGGVNNPHFPKVSTILQPQHFAGWSITVDAFGRWDHWPGLQMSSNA